jgi:hypothetical protein
VARGEFYSVTVKEGQEGQSLSSNGAVQRNKRSPRGAKPGT